MVEHPEQLRPGESVFSSNLVTGHSINFPIAATCSPSTVCGATCYAGTGPITWSASLAKQFRNLGSCKADPEGFADLVAEEFKQRRMDFITWNGSGDLFPESVQAINLISRKWPDIAQWVRTRKPPMASLIDQAPNTWVHFSLDRDSVERWRLVNWKTTNHFFSYQYAPGETGGYPAIVSVVFGHDYKMPAGVDGPEVCPLNKNENIKDICAGCRRCFGGFKEVPDA